MKQYIALALEICGKGNVSDAQIKWEYLKNEIQKFTIQYSKKLSKFCNLRELNWGKNWKNSKTIISYLNDNQECIECKQS